MFLLVFMTAVLIAFVVHSTKAMSFAPPWLYTAGVYAEVTIFALDMLCFVLFLLSEVLRLVRELWLSVRKAYE